ncbi:MAG: outer membrane lipoprotein carrier protein LolA [Crocinitomicaceae bacterium]|nr:outer membrane lipoprotein carrier protein LolA [Crocinitomicaceae bacterium]
MKNISVFLLIMLLIGTSIAQSDDKSQKILDQLSRDIKALNAFTIDFSLQIKNATTGENESQKGSGTVKGNKFFAELDDNLIISNGMKIWTVVKSEKVTYESDADDEDEEAINPKKLMTIWEKGFKNKYVGEQTVGGKKMHVINLFPVKPAEAQYHTISLFVDAASNDLHRAEMKMKDGTKMTYTILKMNKNVEVDNAKFVYDARKFPGFQLIRD